MNVKNGLDTTYLINKIADLLDKHWVKKDNAMLVYPDPKILLNLIIIGYFTLESNFKSKKDVTKRTSVLVVTRNRELFNRFQEMTLNTREVYKYAKDYHQFLRNQKIWCDMNDDRFTMLYWSTYLDRYYKKNVPDVIPLHYIFPVAKGRNNFTPSSRGERNKLGKIDSIQPPSFIFTDTLKTLDDYSQNFDYIFFDVSSFKGNLGVLKKVSTPYFLYFDNPFDDRIYFNLNKETKTYLMDNFAYKNFVNINPTKMEKNIHLPIVDLNNIKFKYVETQFEEVLQEAFNLLSKLKQSNFNVNDLKILSKLLYTAIRMTIEGVEYDFIATYDPQYESIKDLLKEIKSSDNRYENKDFEELIKLIENIYIKYDLDTICPKYLEIEGIAKKGLRVNEKILIVTSSKIDSLGLKEKLSISNQVDISVLESIGIYIKSYREIENLKEYTFNKVILTSAIKLSDLKPFLKDLGDRIIVLLYKIELRELKSKLNALKDVNELHITEDDTVYEILYKKLRRIDKEKDETSKIEIEQLINSIDNIPQNISERLLKPYEQENAVKVKLIKFKDETKVFLRDGSAVRFLLKKEKEIKERHLKDLTGNEEIIIINNDVRKDLFEIFIDNLVEENTAKIHYSIIKEWREMYEDKFIFLKLNDDILFGKMLQLGWDKSTKGILKNWRSGFSFGPRDLKDIILLGNAIDLSPFIEEAGYFYNSMRYIRIQRRVASRILNNIIYSANKELTSEHIHFLESYNLSVEDIEDSVKTKKIVSISKEYYTVKPSEVGKLF